MEGMRALTLPILLLSLAAASRPAGPPPLDHAPLLRARAVTDLTPDAPVVGIELGGDARAYPLRLLTAHVVANDTIDRHPVAIVYCRSCGSVLAYRTDTPKGTLILAASGRYRDGDQLLIDRPTGTLWKQLTGTPVEGPLAGSGIELQPLPVVLTTWTAWFQAHNETRVSAPEKGSKPEPKPGAVADEPRTPLVFGVVLNGAARAYPVDRVAKEGVIDDELGGRPIVLVAEAGADPANRTIRAFERGDRVFARSGHSLFGTGFINDQDGHPWKVGEEALGRPDGRQLPRLPGKLTAAAGWSAAYPQGGTYGEAKTPPPEPSPPAPLPSPARPPSPGEGRPAT
jgi:hypothetical protein